MAVTPARMPLDYSLITRILAPLGWSSDGYRQFRAVSKRCNIFQLCLAMDTVRAPGIFGTGFSSNVWPLVVEFLWGTEAYTPPRWERCNLFAIRATSFANAMTIWGFLVEKPNL